MLIVTAQCWLSFTVHVSFETVEVFHWSGMYGNSDIILCASSIYEGILSFQHYECPPNLQYRPNAKTRLANGPDGHHVKSSSVSRQEPLRQYRYLFTVYFNCFVKYGQWYMDVYWLYIFTIYLYLAAYQDNLNNQATVYYCEIPNLFNRLTYIIPISALHAIVCSVLCNRQFAI